MLWDQLGLPWQGCLEEAWQSFCANSLPIGAVITDQNGEIIARGRNRIFETGSPDKCVQGSLLAHAEINALLALGATENTPKTNTLYSTTEPCPQCVGAIRMNRIGAVNYASRDSAAGSIKLLSATEYMRRRERKIYGPQDPALEAVIVAMHAEFRLNQGATTENKWVLDTWGSTVPLGVALGHLAFQSGILRQLKAQRASAGDAVNQLGKLLQTI